MSKRSWSQEEDYLILATQGKVGNKWKYISKLLPGRSDNDVKNRFHCLMNRLQTKVKSCRLVSDNKLPEMSSLSSTFSVKSETELDSLSSSSDMKLSPDVLSSSLPCESSSSDYTYSNYLLDDIELPCFDMTPPFSFSQYGDAEFSFEREQLF